METAPYQDDLLNFLTSQNQWVDAKRKEEDAEKIAYQKAYHNITTSREKAMRAYFESKLHKAFDLSEVIHKDLSSKQVECEMYLKTIDFELFEVLCIISKEDYLSEKRKSAYQLVRKLKKKENNNEFSIDFSFMPKTKEVNYGRIIAEGFKIKYEPKSR